MLTNPTIDINIPPHSDLTSTLHPGPHNILQCHGGSGLDLTPCGGGVVSGELHEVVLVGEEKDTPAEYGGL